MMLSSDDLARVSDAIRAAERQTSGEIVVVVDRVAGHFTAVPVVMALVMALLAPWPLLWLTDFSAQRVFFGQIILALALLAGFLWIGHGGRFVPGFIRRRRAHDVAVREFMVRGLSRTQDRTGILIYTALAERYAEVIADTAIADRVDPSAWREIIEEITDATRDNRLADGLVQAVSRAGTLLAADFPPRETNDDELSNKVIVI